jgi:hypothetical protein
MADPARLFRCERHGVTDPASQNRWRSDAAAAEWRGGGVAWRRRGGGVARRDAPVEIRGEFQPMATDSGRGGIGGDQ